jgi:hydrogenase maturation protease
VAAHREPSTSEGGLGLDVGPHGFEPGRALGLARAVGAKLPWLRVVGCEPAPLSEMCMTLSPAVEAAVDEAVALVTSLIGEREDSYAHA